MSDHDPRGLYGHHPDCPMSRHGDSVLVRTAMHPCNFCEVADKAEQRGREDFLQETDLYQQGQRDKEQELLGGVPMEEHDRRIIMKNYEQGQRDEREKHHTHYCCAICDFHVMPHRRCILR